MNVPGVGSIYQPTYTYRGETRVATTWWWRRPKTLGGGRVPTHLADHDAAVRWVLSELTRPAAEVEAPRRAAPTVDEMLDALDARLELAGNARTLSTARSRLRYLRAAFGARRASTLTADDATAYAAQRRRAGAAVDTVNAELAWLSRSYRLSVRARRLTLADVPVIDRLRGAVRRTGTLERGELEAVLGRIPARYRPIIEAIYWSGWREGEILGLAWDRVRLPTASEPGEIRVDKHKTGIKTGSRTLSFRSDSALARILRAQWARRSMLGPYVFSVRGGRPVYRSTLQRHWRAACRAAGLPDARIIHDLRRTMARDIRRAGASPFVGMSVLGHTDVRTHQGYSMVDRQDQEDALEGVERLRAGEPVQQRLLPFAR